MNSTTTFDHENIVDVEEHHSWSEKAWPILTVLAPICLAGFVSNAIVVWVFIKWRVLRDQINLFVVNLAVSNLAICFVAPPLIALPIFLAHAAETTEQEIITDLIYRISACLFGISCYANSFATTAIALHRRRMILKPRAQMKNERPQIAICFIMWGISFVLAVPELFRCATAKEDHEDKADLILPTLLGPYERLSIEVVRVSLQFLLVSGLMIFSYVSVFFALRKRSIIRAQFQRDKSLKAQAERLSAFQFKKPCPGLGKTIVSERRKSSAASKNHVNIHAKSSNCLTDQAKTGRRPTITGSCITAAAASVAATTTTVVANSNGRPQSTSCETVEYILTNSGQAPGGQCSNNPSPSMGSKLRPKVPSKMKHVWDSIRKEKKFSASDSKNVIILIATIVVHFACWSPYNAVRFYFAIVEALNNSEEPRAPLAESILLCIAVSSVLHCPIFYTWFNRRNRHGLIACCAAIIPCRDSILRRRLREIAHQGNSYRHRLPLPADTPPIRSPRRASRLQSRFQSSLMRRYSRGGVMDELRTILFNAQRRTSMSSTENGLPPARHNSFAFGLSGYDSNAPNERESMSGSAQGHKALSPQSSIILNCTNVAYPMLFQSFINEESSSKKENSTNHEKVDKNYSTEMLEKAIYELARKVSNPTQEAIEEDVTTMPLLDVLDEGLVHLLVLENIEKSIEIYEKQQKCHERLNGNMLHSSLSHSAINLIASPTRFRKAVSSHLIKCQNCNYQNRHSNSSSVYHHRRQIHKSSTGPINNSKLMKPFKKSSSNFPHIPNNSGL